MREGADIDDALGVVGALQRRQRAAVIAELAVVIVLDDPGVALIGGGEQLGAARQAHLDAGRMLVRRRDEGQPEVRREAQPGLDRDALRVDRHWHHARAAGDETVARADRAGVFEPDRIAGIDQHAADQVEGLLRAVDDEDLLGVAGDAPVGAQMLGDRAGAAATSPLGSE